MTLTMRELERVDTRVLGALRCIDATTRAHIDAPLDVRAANASLLRNRSGLFVIARVQALLAHTLSFDAPPAQPALGSIGLSVQVRDPAGRYLPRLVQLALPRDPLPAHATQAGSLFRAVEVPLYPASACTTGANWAVLRASVRDTASGDALGGALLIVTNNGNLLGRGLSDWRGEALVAVPGVPATTWSDDPHAVVVSEIAAQIEAVFDPASGTRVAATQVRAGRAPARLPLVDPDALEAQRAALPHATQAVSLAAARAQSLSLTLALP